MDVYKIYALRYAGPEQSSQALLMWNRDWDHKVQRAYYFWCLLGPQGPVLVDCGVSPERAAQRNLKNYVNPVELLKGLGIKPHEVRHLVLSHLHWDHCGGAGLFPQAQVHLGRAEWDFWSTSPLVGRSIFTILHQPGDLAALTAAQEQGRLHLHTGDAPLAPGLELIAAPGHSPGLMALEARTSQGEAVLASDCGHTFANFAEDWPSIFIFDLPAWLVSMERLRSLAAGPELLFPGHDIRMSEDYPEVAPGVTRLV
ncbi:MAG: N-acyl homoserine lactonase family protein [Desulfarculaceae bacterium]|nr:N-acyl homoserine lactonase family protein [Desulfarculaceae bacterium]MCF8048328.1 N-acyl homoserine lactonase family protein [Desulfarculaceae bacterium]MCF8064842.1 N-acyl homoserine lactonase family protein [Desulfarculaceae bacterium]MCF8099662.1 N-acyl homoserine lactonase family protein [Desulfarculaceae bacterium]MCF8123503.1 N-acyl homoserine lactonase family protein [Desulfarculaceae bacterium]